MAEPETDKSAAEGAFWAAAALEEHDDSVMTMQEQLLKLVGDWFFFRLLLFFLPFLCFFFPFDSFFSSN